MIGDERATLDVVSLLIEAHRTDVTSALDGEVGLLVADNREFPLAHYETARELAVGTRNALGGSLDVRRPRESGPFPWEIRAGRSAHSPTPEDPNASFRLV